MTVVTVGTVVAVVTVVTKKNFNKKLSSPEKLFSPDIFFTKKTLHTKNHETSLHKKITQPLHTQNNAISQQKVMEPHQKESHNLSKKKHATSRKINHAT